MFIPDDEKDDRKAAIQKLMDLMSSETGKRLGGLKKPIAAGVMIEKDPDKDGDDDMPDPMEKMGDSDDEQEPSDEEKAEIERKYHKFCMGGRA
jgi:hypothetical protein